MNNIKNKMKVVILGAGPCGMTAGWELSQNGYDVAIVEKDAVIGGLCKTVSCNGFRFDLGGHRFITKNERLKNMVVDLMKDELLIAERKSVMLLKGKEYDYPLQVKNLFSNLELSLFAKALFDYLKKSLRNSKVEDISFKDWITNRYGETLYDIFFGPYTAKLWGISPNEISSDWAEQRIAGLNLGDIIMRLLRVKRDKKRTFTKRFYYPKEGIGQIFECVKKEIEKNGGKFHFNSRPIEFEASSATISSVTIKAPEGVKKLPCDFLISTIPIDELHSLLGGKQSASNELSYRALRFLNILVDKDEISPNTWMYVSEDKYFMTRIQEPKKRSPFSAPLGKSSVMLEIPCNVGDNIYKASDEELLKRSIRELKELGVDLDGKILGRFSTYADYAYPIYAIDYKERVKERIDYIQRYNNMITCGRQGLFRYIFMDMAMEMGLGAADYIMGKGTVADIYNAGLEKSLLEVKSIV